MVNQSIERFRHTCGSCRNCGVWWLHTGPVKVFLTRRKWCGWGRSRLSVYLDESSPNGFSMLFILFQLVSSFAKEIFQPDRGEGLEWQPELWGFSMVFHGITRGFRGGHRPSPLRSLPPKWRWYVYIYTSHSHASTDWTAHFQLPLEKSWHIITIP